MKKIISILCMILITGLLCSCKSGKPNEQKAEKANPISDFEYTVNDKENYAVINKYIGESKTVVIPNKIDNKNVTKIRAFAFTNNQFIVSVKIPDTVAVIEETSFNNCSNLEYVKLPSKLKTIGSSAFEKCISLSKISLPSNLTKIGWRAFIECKSLKKITIPKSLESIGPESFAFSGLEEIKIMNGLEEISDSAFAKTNISKIILPESIKKIDSQAFAGCKSLISIKLNEGITGIENFAFANNSKLTEIVIPKSVKVIKASTFSGCDALKKVKFKGDAPNKYLDSDAINNFVNNSNYTVYYHRDAKGFTPNTWNGYKSEIW